MFDRALAEAGIDRARVYVTNAVKHFKFEPRGKRRIHKTPNNAEIDHCRWWVEGELDLIKPQLTVALGATRGARAHRPQHHDLARARAADAVQRRRDGPRSPCIRPILLRLPDRDRARRAEYRALSSTT